MKKLHYPVRVFNITLKNGQKYEIKRSCMMTYSEPQTVTEGVYSSDNLLEFINEYGFYIYTDYTLMFKKYMRLEGCRKKMLLKDIKGIVVSIEHCDVTTNIRDIGKQLKYEEFLQFIFDKEQELRSATTSMKG